MTYPRLHPSILEGGVTWYGGIGHHFITTDGPGDGSEPEHHCYRCGMIVAPSAIAGEYLVPDCGGPEMTGHYWVGSGRDDAIIVCEFGDARQPIDANAAPVPCVGVYDR